MSSETFKCCGALSAGNVGTNRSGVETDLEWTRSGVFVVFLERVGWHILALGRLNLNEDGLCFSGIQNYVRWMREEAINYGEGKFMKLSMYGDVLNNTKKCHCFAAVPRMCITSTQD